MADQKPIRFPDERERELRDYMKATGLPRELAERELAIVRQKDDPGLDI